MMRRGLYIDLTVALLGFGYFFSRAHFPFTFALLAGLAFGAGSFATRRTVGQLLQLYGPAGPDPEAARASESDDVPGSDSDSETAGGS
ncbi:MAG: hypothetical protein AAFY88_21300 [Acidobacteriota bacterium]